MWSWSLSTAVFSLIHTILLYYSDMYFPCICDRFHHVWSLDRNIAVNIWWSASAKPYLPNCNLPNTTIDQLEFHGFNELYPREVVDGMK